jgi:hypothetical protein
MFFNISRNKNIEFPVHVQYAGLFIDLDNGWTNDNGVISKGLKDNKCIITCKNNTITITVDRRRTFPLFYDEEHISNIINYTNEFFTNEDLSVLNDIVTVIKSSEPREFTDLKMNDDQLFDYLYDYLDDKVGNFEDQAPIKFFPTGGVDTGVIMSFVLKHKIPFELLTAEYKDMDYFTCHTRSRIGKFWAYRNIHHWKEPSILLSGTNGDEMMLRNPHDAYLIGKIHGEDILQTLENSNTYHSHYFLRNKHKPGYDEIDTLDLTLAQARQRVIDRNYCDYQHWHLGNTLTWTPLNDLTLVNIMLNFSYPYVRTQLLDAGISKQLIIRNNPDLLKFVSPSKNNINFQHLHKVFEGLESFK